MCNSCELRSRGDTFDRSVFKISHKGRGRGGGLIGFSISRLLEVDGEGRTDFLQICNFDFNSDGI